MPFNSGFSALSPVAVMDGSAVAPPVSFRSESSLGLYRSGASVLALSYGTLDTSLGQINVGAGIISGTITDSGFFIFANTVGCLFNNSSGNQGALMTDGGGLLILRHGPSGLQLRNNGNTINLIQLTDIGNWSILSGNVLAPSNSSIFPSYGFSSNSSLGFYSSGAQTIAQSLGTLNLATNAVRLSMRTIAASSVTASAANTNVAVNEAVFTIQASGASFVINSGGTTWIFNSSASAKNT